MDVTDFVVRVGLLGSSMLKTGTIYITSVLAVFVPTPV